MWSTSSLTTLKLTSASSRAMRISFSASPMFSSVSVPCPRRFLKARCSLSVRFSNIVRSPESWMEGQSTLRFRWPLAVLLRSLLPAAPQILKDGLNCNFGTIQAPLMSLGDAVQVFGGVVQVFRSAHQVLASLTELIDTASQLQCAVIKPSQGCPEFFRVGKFHDPSKNSKIAASASEQVGGTGFCNTTSHFRAKLL